jgi:hypothetical protein
MRIFTLETPSERVGSEGEGSEYPWLNATELRYTATVYLVHLFALVSLVLGSGQEHYGSIASLD